MCMFQMYDACGRTEFFDGPMQADKQTKAHAAEIAKRDRHQVSHVSRTISLAFLAPDIVEMIVSGNQPLSLTPERLKAARPLPRGGLDKTVSGPILLGGMSDARGPHRGGSAWALRARARGRTMP